MLVSLPMYDLPELMEAHRHFWSGLRRHLAAEGFSDTPEILDWPRDLDAAWASPDLLLSQTCGYPLRRQLDGRVRLLGVPHYEAPGCVSYLYSSALIVHVDNPHLSLEAFAGSAAAFNEIGSQSGYSALRHAVAPFAHKGRFFATAIETGRHEHSIDAIRKGKADIAAIDAVTFALLQRHQPERLAGIRRLAHTMPVPGLPFITALSRPADEIARLQRALQAAFADPTLAEPRAALLLKDISFPDIAVYHDIDRLEREAVAAGYPTLA